MLSARAHGRHYFEIYKYIKRKAYRADRQAICNILSVLPRRPLTKRFSQNNSAESTTATASSLNLYTTKK